MKPYYEEFTRYETFISMNKKPDFQNLLSVLNKERPARFTLFEFFMNGKLISALTEGINYDKNDPLYETKRIVDTFRIAGYDYATLLGSDFYFKNERKHDADKSTISINEGGIIKDRVSFENYDWPDPDKADYSRISAMKSYMPEGMKLIIYGDNGILENVIRIVGYESLCYMIYEDPELVEQIFKEVGTRFMRYYEICGRYDNVGALISNDDWGFNTQTFLSPEDMRKYVFPWHKRIVEIIHSYHKPAILHSCGRADNIMDDIILDMKYDARHSYEDNILPVEAAYDRYSKDIAILGGIDLDFICRATPIQVYNRAVAMLEKSADKGAYALGSGNSIPDYVPIENYLAMIAAALFNDYNS